MQTSVVTLLFFSFSCQFTCSAYNNFVGWTEMTTFSCDLPKLSKCALNDLKKRQSFSILNLCIPNFTFVINWHALSQSELSAWLFFWVCHCRFPCSSWQLNNSSLTTQQLLQTLPKLCKLKSVNNRVDWGVYHKKAMTDFKMPALQWTTP